MKSQNTIFLFLFVVLLCMTACKSEKWQGRIYTENGVTVIENKGTGLWGMSTAEKIEFVEELVLGVEEGDDHLMFYNLRNLAVDSQSNIYILDGGNHRLIKFDEEGKFIWSTGREGQGPGEFENPGRVYLTEEEYPVVEDRRSIHSFDGQGQYKKSIKIGKSMRNVTFLPDGRLFVNLFVSGRPGLAAEFYSDTGEFLEKFPVEYRYGPKMSPNLGASIGGGDFQWSGDKVYLSLPDRYEIREYDTEGNLQKKTLRDLTFNPPNISVRADGRGVSVRPSDNSGPCFLYQEEFLINCLRRVEKKSETEYVSERFLDFFNAKGQFLGSHPLPEGLTLGTVDSSGKFYFIQWNPFPKIIRSRIEFKLN